MTVNAADIIIEGELLSGLEVQIWSATHGSNYAALVLLHFSQGRGAPGEPLA